MIIGMTAQDKAFVALEAIGPCGPKEVYAYLEEHGSSYTYGTVVEAIQRLWVLGRAYKLGHGVYSTSERDLDEVRETPKPHARQRIPSDQAAAELRRAYEQGATPIELPMALGRSNQMVRGRILEAGEEIRTRGNNGPPGAKRTYVFKTRPLANPEAMRLAWMKLRAASAVLTERDDLLSMAIQINRNAAKLVDEPINDYAGDVVWHEDLAMEDLLPGEWPREFQPPPKIHCKHGHELSGENLRVDPRGRHVCRACIRAASLKYKKRNRALQAESRGG